MHSTPFLNCITIKLGMPEIIEKSIEHGTGTRLVIFVQGCKKQCLNCYQPHYQDINSGTDIPIESIIQRLTYLATDKEIDGITITGGEPFQQEDSCYLIAKKAKELGLSVWVYTGYLYDLIYLNPYSLLIQTDVLIHKNICLVQRITNSNGEGV